MKTKSNGIFYIWVIMGVIMVMILSGSSEIPGEKGGGRGKGRVTEVGVEQSDGQPETRNETLPLCEGCPEGWDYIPPTHTPVPTIENCPGDGELPPEVCNCIVNGVCAPKPTEVYPPGYKEGE